MRKIISVVLLMSLSVANAQKQNMVGAQSKDSFATCRHQYMHYRHEAYMLDNHGKNSILDRIGLGIASGLIAGVLAGSFVSSIGPASLEVYSGKIVLGSVISGGAAYPISVGVNYLTDATVWARYKMDGVILLIDEAVIGLGENLTTLAQKLDVDQDYLAQTIIDLDRQKKFCSKDELASLEGFIFIIQERLSESNTNPKKPLMN